MRCSADVYFFHDLLIFTTPAYASCSQVPICLPREDGRLGEPRQVRLTVYAQPLLYGSLTINNTQLACLVGRESNPEPSAQQASMLTAELPQPVY